MSSRDDQYLFPSDRNGLPPARPPASGSAGAARASTPVTHSVKFGGAFSIDQFHFVRSGAVTIDGAIIRYEGNTKRSMAARTGMFLLITLAPLAILHIGLGILPAYYVVNYAWTTHGSLLISARGLQRLERKGRRIRFVATHPETGKLRKADFSLASEDEALRVEQELAAAASFGRPAQSQPATRTGRAA